MATRLSKWGEATGLASLLIIGDLTLRLKLPLILAFALAALIAANGARLSKDAPLRIAVLLCMNFGFWLLSGLVSGGLPAVALAKPEYWFGDGRIFVYYAPLLGFLFLSASERHSEQLLKAAGLLSCLGLSMLLAWLVTGFTIFSAETHDVFIGLQTSHTGAGTMWGALVLVLGTAAVEKRSPNYAALCALATLCLLYTASRQALVGLLASVLFLSISDFRLGRRLVVVLFAGFLLAPLFVPGTVERLSEIVSLGFLESISQIWRDEALAGTGATGFDTSNLTYFNLQMRFVLWRHAIDQFVSSPLVGVGFGRFNDPGTRLVGVPGFVALAAGGVAEYSEQIQYHDGFVISTGNAHNSYLHVLAETGLVGFSLLLLLWRQLYRTATSCATQASAGTASRALGKAGQALVIYTLVGAFFGHGLAAPSVGIVVLAFLGFCVARESGLERERKVSQRCHV